MPKPGDVVVDRFVLERLCGRGAMGVLWRACDRYGAAVVALKLSSPNRIRFIREAELLSRLNHPRIVRYVAHGDAPEGCFLAMEWLDGQDLAQRLRAGPLALAEAIEVVRHIAEALAVAHAAGVVHRDVKPANVFLVHGAISGVKLVDFGVARVEDSSWTTTGSTLGTPAYMAPEQVRGASDIDARADLFALGCIAFECVTGRRAFEGTQVFAVLRRVLFEPVPSLRTMVPEVPPELDQLVQQLLAKQPADRPPDASAVVLALSALAASRPQELTSARRWLSERELRSTTVLAVKDPGAGAIADGDDVARTALYPDAHQLDPTGSLGTLLESAGGQLGRHAAGSFVVSFPGPQPRDRAARAAACALELSALWPARSLALATDWVDMERWTEGVASARAVGMLAAAQPHGGVQLDATTAALLDDRYAVQLGPRGAELLPADRVADMRPRAPFVNRTRELSAIQAVLSQCIEESVARAALVTAPTGFGKSRLRERLVAELKQQQNWQARVGALRDSGAHPYELVSQLMRHVDLPMLGSPTQQTFLDALARALTTGPVVMVLDDLHRADSASLQAVDAALERFHDRPLMVLGFARPELHMIVPHLRRDRFVEELRLTSLAFDSSAELLHGVTHGALSDAQARVIHQDSEGIPWLLEALGLAAARGEHTPPNAALAMVEARLDLLPPESRRVLRAAGALGRTFVRSAVVELLGPAATEDDSLPRLIEHAWIEPVAVHAAGCEPAYRFCTALGYATARATLTPADRRLAQERPL